MTKVIFVIRPNGSGAAYGSFTAASQFEGLSAHTMREKSQQIKDFDSFQVGLYEIYVAPLLTKGSEPFLRKKEITSIEQLFEKLPAIFLKHHPANNNDTVLDHAIYQGQKIVAKEIWEKYCTDDQAWDFIDWIFDQVDILMNDDQAREALNQEKTEMLISNDSIMIRCEYEYEVVWKLKTLGFKQNGFESLIKYHHAS